MTTYVAKMENSAEVVLRKIARIERSRTVPDFGYCICGEGALDTASYCKDCGAKLVWPVKPVPIAMQELQEDERMNA